MSTMNTQQEEGLKEAEKQPKSVWRLVKKVLKWTGWFVGGFFVIAWMVGTFAKDVSPDVPAQWIARGVENAQSWLLERKLEAVREKYRNDFDGGKTPEETLDLFIAALKRGDIEQASKYYVLEKQGEELAHLRDDILGKYGDLQKSIDFYTRIKEKGTKWCNEKGTGCIYEYVFTETATTTYNVVGMNQKIIVPPGEKTTESIDVALNKLSGVWKIELP